jgi:hypothetical protein
MCIFSVDNSVIIAVTTGAIVPMAKRKAVRKRVAKSKAAAADDRTPRKEPYTAGRISLHVERLREQAARMAGLARAMEDAGVDEIVVDGHAMLLRGLNQVDNFADNAARAVREAKTALMES